MRTKIESSAGPVKLVKEKILKRDRNPKCGGTHNVGCCTDGNQFKAVTNQ